MDAKSRRAFLRTSAQLAATACLAPVLAPLGIAATQPKVLIIGAGAAGMTAAYLLASEGIDFTLLEAAPHVGGRMKRLTGFVDFPIPLGAEWLHGPESLLRDILARSGEPPPVRTVGYAGDVESGWFARGALTLEPLGGTDDRKFVGSTWFDFFEAAVLPAIRDRIRINTRVSHIDYSGGVAGRGVRLSTTDGIQHQADAVLITVPTQVLKDGDIRFTPDLPADKRAAIEQAEVWGGIKVFIEFSERFFPAFLEFPDSDTRNGQRLYYDAAYGQDSHHHVLGLFAVGQQARRYQGLSATDLKARVLGELDAVFAGRASKTYVQHVTQDWSREPHIRSAYLSDHADWRIPRRLARSVDDRLYFAGEACTEGEDWGGVHDAARSAREAVERLLSR
ncbi:MAG: flavin monoamine oxidase family protein [Gammaproteobacteria bacterium]